jgi:uncharacterized membrane protein
MREAGRKQLIIGLVIAGVGLVVSLGTYAAASSGGGGGGYFIFWGAVVFGLIRAARGFSMMSKAGSHAPGASGKPAQPAHAMQRIQVEHASTNEMPPPPPAPQPSSAPPASSMWD